MAILQNSYNIASGDHFFFFLRFETPQNAKKKGAPQNNLFLVVLLELVTHNHIIHICDRG